MSRDTIAAMTSGTLSLTVIIVLTLAVALSAARAVEKTSSSRSSSAPAEFLMDYYIPEELPIGTLIGNVVVDFGLDLKYEPEIVERLRFYFLQPTAVHTWRRSDQPLAMEPEVVNGVRRQHGSQMQGHEGHRGHHETASNDGTTSFGSELFVINNRTGVIRSRCRIDREQVCLTSSPVAATTLRLSGYGVCIFKLDVAVVHMNDVADDNDDQTVQTIAQVLGIRIEVLDINDNAPTFPDLKWIYRMSEAAEPGTEFVVPSAVDLDGDSRGNGIRSYSLIDNDDRFDLKVVRQVRENGGTGMNGYRASVVTEVGPHHVLKLVLRGRLDREQMATHGIIISASDGGTPPRTGSMLVVVDVLDANDNRPEFNQQTFEVWVKESTPPTSVILTVEATDRDIGFNGRVVYSLAPLVGLPSAEKLEPTEDGKRPLRPSAVENHMFGIGPETGRIYIKQPLDHEEISTFALTVTASDLGPDALSSYASVIVHVEDVNDNEPTIVVTSLFMPSSAVDGGTSGHSDDDGERLLARPEVDEDVAVGTLIAHLSATDADSGRNGNVRCSVEELGWVDGREVWWRDGGMKRADDSKRIDESSLSKSSHNNPSTTFELVRIYGGTDYQLVTAARLDREAKSEYRLSVTCRDDGWPRSAASSVNVTVIVADRNDCTPVFERSTYSVTVQENEAVGRSVIAVKAVDDDAVGANSKLHYRLESSSFDVHRYVHLDGDSGLVTLRESLDREWADQLVFDVVAEDAGSPPLTGRTTVQILVLDRDDQKAVFESVSYTFDVDENRPVGTAIGAVRAVDGDLPPFNRVVYKVLEDNYDESQQRTRSIPFSVDPRSGILTTAEVLDREMKSFYLFRVSAQSINASNDGIDQDMHHRVRRTINSTVVAHVTVNVLDVNDNRPIFTLSRKSHTQSKPTKMTTGNGNKNDVTTAIVRLVGRPTIGRVVTRLTAYDPDSPANARALFGLLPPVTTTSDDAANTYGRRQPREFDVNPTTGLVSIGPDLILPVSSPVLGSGGFVRRTIEVTVSDAAEPEVVSDHVVLAIIIYLADTSANTDILNSLQDGDYNDGVISALHDITLVGHNGGVLASERLVLVLSGLLGVVLLAVVISIIALCAFHSSVRRPLGGNGIGNDEFPVRNTARTNVVKCYGNSANLDVSEQKSDILHTLRAHQFLANT